MDDKINYEIYWYSKNTKSNTFNVNCIQKEIFKDEKLLSYVGNKYNRLKILSAIRKEERDRFRNYYHCRCDCGNEIDVRCESVLKGTTKSCGCLNRDKARNRCIKRNTKHGLNNSRLHNIWSKMKTRCYNPNSNRYYRYGGRGITVCDEWLEYDHENGINTGFLNFYNWAMNNGYNDNLTIERIDYNKGYSPDNCKWITNEEQSWNKSNNIHVTYEQKFDEIGKPPIRYTFPLSIWSKITGINRHTLRVRLIECKDKWTVEEALTTPATFSNSNSSNRTSMMINIGEYIHKNQTDKYDISIHD